MKTKAVVATEVRIGDTIRFPVGQTLYHLVTASCGFHAHPEHKVCLGVDSQAELIEFNEDEFVYVLAPETGYALSPRALTHADTATTISQAATGQSFGAMGSIDLIIRDVCETDPADPEADSTVCISVPDLQEIIERHVVNTSQPAAPAEPIYQQRDHEHAHIWHDTTKRTYAGLIPELRRIVYAAPSQPAAPAAQIPQKKTEHIGGAHWGWEGEFNLGWNAAIDAMNSAAADGAAQGATLTDDEAALLTRIKHFHTHDFGRGPELHSDAISDAYKKGRTAPTPVADNAADFDPFKLPKRVGTPGQQMAELNQLWNSLPNGFRGQVNAAKPVSVDAGGMTLQQAALAHATEQGAAACVIPIADTELVVAVGTRENLTQLLTTGVSGISERTHTTRGGESLAGIALRECGDEIAWHAIVTLNPDFVDWMPCDYFPVGTVLKLPARVK